MKYQLDKSNNSNKIIIGVSIIFCTIILIIGATTAYFTQSSIGETGNIVTENINGTIGFSGSNKNYMRNNLIPVEESDVSLFAMKNTSNKLGNYTNDDICLYQNDMYACSLYQFTITNNSNVTQDMMVTLNPYPNGFANLHYIVYEEEQDKLKTESIVAKTNTHIDGTNPNTMINSVILKPQQSKTYTVVFYIKNLKDIDQTSMDAGKNFGAIIRVDSITTGTYVLGAVGETCYGIESLEDGTYKLTSFNGVDENGTPIAGCGVTQDEEGLYDIDIPSKVGNNEITEIGDSLFYNNNKIKSVSIPANIKVIGKRAYWVNEKLTTVIFEGTEDDTSKLQTIGQEAFASTKISSVVIPASVIQIAQFSFYNNLNLTDVIFKESNDENLEMTIGANAFASTGITSVTFPKKTTSIETVAFGWNGTLKSVTFSGALDGTSKLQKIGMQSFIANDLTYDSDSNPLILPPSVNTIESGAFAANSNLKYVYYTGDTTGFESNWVDSGVTILKELVTENQ